MHPPALRLGASSASLPSLAPEALADELARLGYQGVEWRVADTAQLDPSRPWDARLNNRCTIAPDAVAVERISRRCQALGLQIFGLSPYLPVGDLEQAWRLIDLAELAGHARLRLWAPSYEEQRYADALARMRRFLDRLVPRAAEQGVQLALEVHQRTICSSPSLAMRIAEHYPARHLGIIYDMGNLAIEGREDVQLSLDLMGEHLAHVQVKNVAYSPQAPGCGWKWEWCPPDAGVLPLHDMLATLARNGFADWVSIEDFSCQYDDHSKLLRNRDLLMHYLGLDALPATNALIDNGRPRAHEHFSF
ncbi:sugar phosphate isomerase/epimerase [Pseudomonas sp. DTU_2021_1001937_2_SI_NGA_ILE_001]|uniref:sugar phosphate isomerase/epimerase family protein n=1 Tax=Pseudomonas sp. DTU_2021_1001937_2_SI_NGA_ILE_001 TaxID=3077589 RepID=UPI0028FC18C3|nr:sugar phosphate isomerase/epimerase [Pseudomonas sp. DTU_2021_1001937_2_SI_NGA_ILE_001]WNW11591.1 sugar phosphate isomerase/epimerase [Pseudomonas sp. DTU_2021_1001937_2_SI_NGA_ILE_001]